MQRKGEGDLIEKRWVLGLFYSVVFFPTLYKAKCYCSEISTDCIMLCIKDYKNVVNISKSKRIITLQLVEIH